MNRIGLKTQKLITDQFVHVPTSVDTQNVIQIHARVFD